MNNGNNFKPIGEIARNLLKKIISERVDQLCRRHIAKTMKQVDYLTEEEKQIIKDGFKFFSNDVITEIIDYRGLSDEDNIK